MNIRLFYSSSCIAIGVTRRSAGSTNAAIYFLFPALSPKIAQRFNAGFFVAQMFGVPAGRQKRSFVPPGLGLF